MRHHRLTCHYSVMCCVKLLRDIYTPGSSQYGFLSMHVTVMACQAEDCANTCLCKELRSYLAVQLECIDNVVSWWGVCHCF